MTAFEKGLALHEAGRGRDALEQLELATREEPESAEAWYWFAVVQDALGLESTAVPCYREALRLGCRRAAEAHAYLASSLQKTWNASGGYGEIQRALAVAPDNALFHLIHANVLADMRRWKEAEEEYRVTLRLDPKRADAWHRLGQLLGAAGRHQEAWEAFKAALEYQEGF